MPAKHLRLGPSARIEQWTPVQRLPHRGPRHSVRGKSCDRPSVDQSIQAAFAE